MKRTIAAGVLLAGLVAVYQVTAGANGSKLPASSSLRAKTVEDRAVDAHNAGLRHRDRGLMYEQNAEGKSGADRQRAEARARIEFQKALNEFQGAIELSPTLFQAYNGMGYALRKMGNYTKALEMYDRAIEMAPGLYTEAMEYRAEAYLGLNRIDDAKQSYLDLFGADRKQAELLLTQMKLWVAKRQAVPAGVDPQALAAFEKWIAERAAIAQVTARMTANSAASTW